MDLERRAQSSSEPKVEDVSEAVARNHTHHDQRDMHRMGKKQELMRNFRMLTSIAFTSCVMGTWELLLTTTTSALIAGGLAGIWWQFFWVYFGQTFIVLSLAEMSSMAPTAGGQYHWVSEFAPPKYQKILSYASGWLSTLAWQAFVAVDSFICGELTLALVSLNNPGFVTHRWHQTVLMIAWLIIFASFNIFASSKLALVEGIFAVLHFLAWIPIVGVLWAMTPVKQTPKAVFTEFTDNGSGWNNIGLIVCIGQVGAMFTVVGSDASAHMAEEISDAGIVVPRSMWWSFVLNIVPAMTILATYVFCIPDINTVLQAPTGFPIISVFQNSTGTRGATGLTAVMLILLAIITASCMASTSRQTFAFARDNGMIFSRWMAHVSPRWQVPVNSILATVIFSFIMSLINLGSTTAFNAFLSVSVTALMATYSISIACVLYRRLYGAPLPPARWMMLGSKLEPGKVRNGALGKYGVPINIMALVYSAWAFFWSFWPVTAQVTAPTMNWAVVIFAGVMTLAGVAFVVHARKVYDGPVATVRKTEQGETSD